MSLPTYEDTVRGPNELTFVAPYLDRISLLDACIACKKWYQAFGSHLWSDPIKLTAQTRTPFCEFHPSGFPSLHQLMLCIAKTDHFFRRAKLYPEAVRDWVLTLDFRQLKLLENRLLKDFNSYSQVTTPKYALHFLPLFENLRFLVINHMGRFDYEPLDDIEVKPPREDTRLLLFSSAGIPFLDTSLFLSTPLLYNVMYLDLSNTTRTEAWTQLLTSRVFNSLRILKLRGLRLTDQNLPVNALHSWLRLWSLDLRDNSLTDQTIDVLLEECFAPKIAPTAIGPSSDEMLYEDPPLYQLRDQSDYLYISSDSIVPLRPDSTDTFMAYMKQYADLTSDASHVLPEKDPMRKSTGLTHLYISDNGLTSRGIRKLLENTNRLQVLDVGTVRTSPSLRYPIPHTTPYCQPDTAYLLHRQTGTRIENLRIHHSIITQTPTIVQGRLENGYTPQHLAKAERFSGKEPQGFNPLDNYRLTSLTLTDIPLKSTGPTITRLIDFLRLCALQEATLLSASQSGTRNRRSPRLLPGLRRLRLEFLNERAGADEIGPSVSGDQDADEFQAQSMGDFSFFADEKPTSPLSRRGSEAGGWNWPIPGSAKSSVSEVVESKDVVEELKVFRREGRERKWGGSLELVVPRGR